MQKNTIYLLSIAACFAACDGETNYFYLDDPRTGPMTDGAVVTPDGSVPDGDVPDAMVPQPLGRDNVPNIGAQIDRVGRPAISTATVATFSADSDAKNMVKDAYNANGDPSTWGATFADSIAGSLAILDALDANCGNQLLAGEGEAAYAGLAGVLSDDKLYLNVASGVCEGTYLGVEAEVVGALDDGAGGCGGRSPNEDIIDRSYSVLAAGILTGVDDGLTGDDATHSLTDFPFLAAPN